ncbi:MAG: hypothetical protein IH991_24440 [Planctomycetes bacterium]|nr:hypothetical protein [Planctomycetota bacterium]
MNIVNEHFDHPALELFNEKRNGNLAEGKITGWYQLGVQDQKADESADRPAVIVLARLDTGDPFLVEKQFGRGRVMQCATSCDEAWSNLPMRPFYLPLTQRLITYLATSVEPPRNVPVGESLVALLPDDSTTKTVTLTMPDGKDVQLSVRNKGDRKTVEHTDTDQTGLYTMKMSGMEMVHFVVSGSRDESDLTQLDEDELQSPADSMSASVVASSDEYFNLDSTRRYGREIWRLLFWALLIFLVAELLLQQLFSGKLRIGKRRVTSGGA